MLLQCCDPQRINFRSAIQLNQVMELFTMNSINSTDSFQTPQAGADSLASRRIRQQ